MKRHFSRRSQAALRTVHPVLQRVCEHALHNGAFDFAVVCGVRTKAEQTKLVSIGASHTSNSLHLPQRDGYSHAVDLLPFAAGAPRMEDECFAQLAEDIRTAWCATASSAAADFYLRWGGIWNSSCLSTHLGDYAAMVFHARRNQAFVDCYHFEIRRLTSRQKP